jgi:triacylglycerol lipase
MNLTTLSIAAEMAVQSYRSRVQVPGFHVSQHIHGNIQWFSARDAYDLWVAFRGTDEVADWVDNLNVSKTISGHGHVHKGFSDALDMVWWSVMDEMYSKNVRHLHVVGHSLGGALAAVAASRSLFSPVDNHLHLWTFGQPRCGDKQWAAWMNERLGERYIRVFNAGDVVPHLPSILRFRHAGTEVFFDERGSVVSPTFQRRVLAAIEVIRTQFPSSIVRLGAHSMDRYRENVLSLLGKQ